MYYGRKPCDIESRKNQYMLHVKKLQEVKSGRSPFHRSLGRERKDMDEMIKISHQIHSMSLREQFKRRDLTELESQKRTYNSVRSIVKSQLNRKILTVPPRHKLDTYFLQRNNLKLIDKIVNAKSQFNFKKMSLQKLAIAKIRNETNEDYSEIYQKSFINQQKIKQIYLKIGKAKLNNKISFHFLNNESLDCFKKDGLFVIELKCDDKVKHSREYMLEEILRSQIHISYPENQIALNFFQKVGERLIKRFKLCFTKAELNSNEKIWTSKAIEDTKNRVIGLVELEIKKRKEGIQKNIFYDQIVHRGQKENADPVKLLSI